MPIQKLLKLNPSAHRFFNPARVTIVTMLFAAIITSCITVNVNFPESAVQRAADDFVHDLYHGTEKKLASDSPENASTAKKTKSKKKAADPVAPTTMLLDWLITPAFAQELSFSPKAKEIMQTMRGRLKDIIEYKKQGVLCEESTGMLGIQDMSKAGAKAGDVARLVKTENDERTKLFSEMASENHINDPNQKRIRTIFAGSFTREGPPACK